MTNKTYNQYCPVAHALDQIGERWTLLIIRNLVTGPKRFSDLQKGLPGISTNILTDRLKQLEDDRIIRTRYLPPPAASTVYELNPDEEGLIDVLGALARWGNTRLGKPAGNQVIVPEGVAFMVLGLFRHPVAPTFTLTCVVDVIHTAYEAQYGVTLDAHGVALNSNVEAAVRMRLDLETLAAFGTGELWLRDLVADGRVHLEGEPAAVETLIRWVDDTVSR